MADCRVTLLSVQTSLFWIVLTSGDVMLLLPTMFMDLAVIPYPFLTIINDVCVDLFQLLVC
jgi:hypothetical protein